MLTGSLAEVVDNRALTEGMAEKVELKALRWSEELLAIVPSDPRLPLLKPAQIRSRDRSAFSAAIMALSARGGDLGCEGPRAGVASLVPSDSKLSCTDFVSNFIRNGEIYSPQRAGQLSVYRVTLWIVLVCISLERR